MKAKYIGEDNDYLSYGQVYDVTFEGNAKCVVRKNSEIICCLVGDNIKESFETILTHENKNTCSNCKECVYNRMCGSKEKYQQMIKEYNELNKKWDIFESNPPCPEFKDIDKFAEEHGYSKYTGKIENTKDGHLSFEIKPIEQYKTSFIEKEKLASKALEKIFSECGLSSIVIGDASSIKEAKRVNEELEAILQKAYERVRKIY